MKQHRICSVYSGLLLLIFIFVPILSPAQNYYESKQKKDPPPPRNLKVLSEEPDGKGNIVRTIQYDQGVMRVTETIIMPRTIPVGNLSVKINPDTMIKDLVILVVDKTKYCLQVIYRKRMIRTYKATFGPNPQLNKLVEGDRCTPEGWFKITSLNPRSKFNKFMLLNYPNDSAVARFQRLKSAGKLPASAHIGGDIGIHGIWPGGDDLIELGVGWTDGCVALKNKDVEELFSFVGPGTKVYIKK